MDFLFEIGLEEVPARMIAAAEAELLRRVLAMLGRERLLEPAAEAEARSFSTPRRLAVSVPGVRAAQDDVREELMGPAAKIAFRDGLPTAAAEAFAKKNGVAVGALRRVDTPKGEYLAADVVKPGRTAAAVIEELLPPELAAIYWAKNMYWLRAQDTEKQPAQKPVRFVRPVVWMVCLLGEQVVPVEFAGKVAGRCSFGHRVLSSGDAFEVQAPASYAAQLEGEWVMADVEARRQRIRKALDRVTRTVQSARWREDEALVDTVTHLTEWPAVLRGEFEPEFLALPEEVLVTVMRDHQKYFAVEDAHGKLAPHFLAVVNIALDERNAAIIRQGNERVLRARFNDAKFFWEFDQRTPLEDRVRRLEQVTFQKELGSYAAKTERVRRLAKALAADVAAKSVDVDVDVLDKAALLAKADLTTELVKEFTELQGIIGGLYARAQGLPERVAEAIYDQYMPAGMEDGVPRSVEGALLGIADRADTIAGMFGLGLVPTGSKDPFALRRAANAIVKILAETALPLTLEQVIAASTADGAGISGAGISGAGISVVDTAAAMQAFFRERVAFYLRDVKGQAFDVVAAVLSADADDVRDAVARAQGLTAVRGGDDFAAVAAAFKRMKNILGQASEKGIAPAETDVETGTADRHPAMLALRTEFVAARSRFGALASAGEYVQALEVFARLRGPVDQFFADVMVMDPDASIAGERLGLLREIVRTFSTVADFGEMAAS